MCKAVSHYVKYGMFVATVGTIDVLQRITRMYHMTCTFTLMTQAGYRKGATLYFFSVSTLTTTLTNLRRYVQCVPLATKPGISLIILTPMKILQ
jgi:hypothetical protein